MNVLAESNFVLEIALRQDEASHANRILELAEAGDIRLVVPAYALAEPLHKLGRDRKNFRELAERLREAVQQMSRSADFSRLEATSVEIMTALAVKPDVDKRAYDEASRRILAAAEIVPMTGPQLSLAMSGPKLFLGPQDSVIFSAVSQFLEAHPGETSIFVNKNALDFMAKPVSDELTRLGCKLIVKFAAARSYIENSLATGAG